MSRDLQVRGYEALCSALYQMPFTEFLGEKDIEGGRAGWFHIGEAPKDMRVQITIPDQRDEIVVLAEWRNYFADAREPLLGAQQMTVSTYAAIQQQVEPAIEDVLLRVLNLYKEVLAETGVAGKISDLVEDSGTDDEG